MTLGAPVSTTNAPPGARSEPVQTIFLRGVAPRSGTNFVRDLVLLHPDVERARQPIWEDFALDDAAAVRTYVERLQRRWPASWDIPTADVADELYRAVGAALRAVVGHERANPAVVVANGFVPFEVSHVYLDALRESLRTAASLTA